MDILLGPDDSIKAHRRFREVAEFFRQHETARIIVVIDTHCLENGVLVYEGSSPETYKACLLPEVSIFNALLSL